jgi:hypothetical protein
MFRTSAPVTAAGFHGRQAELAELTAAFDSLTHGAPAWVAITGPRKAGRTSLLLEAARQTSASVHVAVLDVLPMAPLTTGVFTALALRAVDALLSAEAGACFEAAARDRRQYQRLLDSTPAIEGLPAGLRTRLREIGDRPPTAADVRGLLQLPEDLAAALGRRLVLAIDGVQELASLARGRAAVLDPFPVMRAIWQRHEHVSYVIAGSDQPMIMELACSSRSPFFGHFRILRLGALARSDAVSLLLRQSPPDRQIPREVAERCADIFGGHPFYLQLAGEALVASEPPYDDFALKQVVQSLVFSRGGQLGLYFENEYHRLAGSSTALAAVLAALAGGPLALADIARSIRASAASTATYLDRLGDVVARQDDRSYVIADRVFAAWLRWRAPGGTVVPMALLGDAAEIAVASHLAGLGFELEYQSRASRSAFDLLAVRGSSQLGVQIRRGELPLRFSQAEWEQIGAEAGRWGCPWAVAQVDPAGQVRVLDPETGRRGREIRIDDGAETDNLLRWLGRRSRLSR